MKLWDYYIIQIPTALAKIVGVYHISMHNSQTNDSMEGDFLVIENLLYGHKCSKVCLQVALFLLLISCPML